MSLTGLLEVHWQRPYFKTLLSAVSLAKCCKAKLWENSKYVSRQLTGIGESIIGLFQKLWLCLQMITIALSRGKYFSFSYRGHYVQCIGECRTDIFSED